ncbi:M42 family metallopeptidase [Deinococcus fonticola]|uniref:M42 family metallopeptidase n=1 Tax=Deinococcus fonticola TaxID=2528713 RepID=UPI0010753E53|nr:M42 family metallopeptidase [Deinococcus fonticola]
MNPAQTAPPQPTAPDTTEFLLRLLDTPSPTGMTEQAVQLIEQELGKVGVQSQRTKKGALTWEVPGTGEGHVTFSGHVDTLGAMVKGIKGNGRLLLFMLGGYDWATIEGEDVKVHTQSGRVVTGTVVNVRQSTHVHGPALREMKREQSVMEVRLDELSTSAEHTRALGVQVGDFVSLDARPRLMPSGHIKSRHLDNKAAVAIFIEATRDLLKNPAPRTAHFHVTTYEEVGHGAATGIPAHTDELIAVDMAAVGEGQTSSEHAVTLCVADSSGPYDHLLGNRLRRTAAEHGIDLRVDIYPYYGSDGSAAWRAGGNYPVALIGPGVDASHAYERMHQDALGATRDLILAYLRH